MHLAKRLENLLVCPHDMGELSSRADCLSCIKCGRRYPATSGIMHLVTSEAERPCNPKALAANYADECPERLHVDYYRRQAESKEHLYETNGAIRDAVDFIVTKLGVGVDLASGHGGGFIAPIVKRMAPDAVLLATDACLPVIENGYAYLAPGYADRFVFLDTDLSAALCFADASVDVFTGVAVANVNDGNPESLLREVYRCLKPGGWAVLQEMFFAPQSETAAWLARQGNMYSSLSAFLDLMRSFGMRTVRIQEAVTGRGKIDPGDGMPLNASDEWSETVVFLQKRGARSAAG